MDFSTRIARSRQLLHFIFRGHYRAVASQIGSDSRQVEVGQFPFHGFCGFHQLIVVEVAFPQVAQVRHQHHVVHHALSSRLSAPAG